MEIGGGVTGIANKYTASANSHYSMYSPVHDQVTVPRSMPMRSSAQRGVDLTSGGHGSQELDFRLSPSVVDERSAPRRDGSPSTLASI